MFWFWLLLPPFIVGLLTAIGGALQGMGAVVKAGAMLCLLCVVIVGAANAYPVLWGVPGLPQ